MSADHGRREKSTARYMAAAHRVQTAIAVHPHRPADQYKDLRVGTDMSKADSAGLARLLISKGIFTMEEYLDAVADSAEEEAKAKEDQLSALFGINVRTL